MEIESYEFGKTRVWKTRGSERMVGRFKRSNIEGSILLSFGSVTTKIQYLFLNGRIDETRGLFGSRNELICG